jgi:ribosomal protein S18 acetylase RimI-like enzyme
MPDLHIDQMEDAYNLWEQTGWNAGYRISLAEFKKSWLASAVKKCIVQNGQMVAIGRANSDGVMYSMIHDIVVHPDNRDQGLGRSIVLEVVDELKAMKVRSKTSPTNRFTGRLIGAEEQ